MQKYVVSWTIDIECEGDHKQAAQMVAEKHFSEAIASGNYDSACSFTVTSASDSIPVNIDLADSLSDLDDEDA